MFLEKLQLAIGGINFLGAGRTKKKIKIVKTSRIG